MARKPVGWRGDTKGHRDAALKGLRGRKNTTIPRSWSMVRSRRAGGNVSIMFRRKNITLELFRDSTWGKTDNMNVIIRDKNKESLTSSLGSTILVKRLGTEAQATKFAKRYMRNPKTTMKPKTPKFHFSIVAKKWFQSTYGNTYHSVSVFKVSGTGTKYKKELVGRVPFAYGYGEQYLQTAHEILQKAGYYPTTHRTLTSGMASDYLNFLKDKREHPEKFSVFVTNVNRKRDL